MDDQTPLQSEDPNDRCDIRSGLEWRVWCFEVQAGTSYWANVLPPMSACLTRIEVPYKDWKQNREWLRELGGHHRINDQPIYCPTKPHVVESIRASNEAEDWGAVAKRFATIVDVPDGCKVLVLEPQALEIRSLGICRDRQSALAKVDALLPLARRVPPSVLARIAALRKEKRNRG